FGFSRGAYTVRSLAGMVHKSGVLRREHRGMIKQAFKLYKNKKNEAGTEDFKRRYCWGAEQGETVPTIYFVGVWDTVSALGVPFTAVNSLNPFSDRWYGFHDATLHKEIKYGYQALSVDDRRKVFKPKLWDESDLPEGQTLEQVWFAGMHSNVGGGYRRTGLSDITLEWMIGKAQEAGLLLWEDYRRAVLMLPDADGKIYDSRSGAGKLYVKSVREILENARIHESVIQRINNKDNLYAPENIPAAYIVCNHNAPV
ncbi:MAG: hypothetical protein GQ559_10870, partial [Desulfobulbaceae bacterium]|nr:hypothetical protein [Desulfobulbaceae bacterium]